MNHQNEKDTANPWHIGERIDHPFDHKAPEEPKKPEKFNYREWSQDNMIGQGFLQKSDRNF